MENFLISKKLHSDIMDFPSQYMYSCEVVRKGVCITRIGTSRNYSTYTSIQCLFRKLQDTFNCTFGLANPNRCKTGKTAVI